MLYLIAHKVRGQPAFDIAERMECPECHALGCVECDQQGYWWIVSTSGHRAYPYSTMGLFNGIPTEVWHDELGEMPSGLPDHYTAIAAPRLNFTALLPKGPTIRRRL